MYILELQRAPKRLFLEFSDSRAIFRLAEDAVPRWPNERESVNQSTVNVCEDMNRLVYNLDSLNSIHSRPAPATVSEPNT